ncbi:ClpXP protease specificity-enhancing factor [Candidatus Steffania adelgidicola]|uniref:ClpXP protease specificity-enhancing factor n=1 Tax=Candidatus Steffania adelgidicola TaxID=1076626 RepID=UPI001D033AC9|nr:ClpXP protease specificity-enhancing factor [Candidatus Steffania adelgidicola]UDG79570.1 hypothetical protein GFK82_00081 [Candidatus Steffania adelgidicola]
MQQVTQMSPRRPYLLEAFYKWLIDNELTPYLVVDINLEGVIVPTEFASNGQIVLNIAPRAIINLIICNDNLQFNARFNHVPQQVIIPMAAVLAIYARENGAGTMFESEPAYKKQPPLIGNTKHLDITSILSVIDTNQSSNTKINTIKDKEKNTKINSNSQRRALHLVK